MAIWFPVFPIYKSVPFWEFGQCKLPPIDFTEDQKIYLSNVCIRECFIVSYSSVKKENSELRLVFFSGTAAFLKSLFKTFFLLFLPPPFLFSCCCVAAFQNFFVVFWIGCLAIKRCLFFISLNHTHLGSYLLKIWFGGGIRWCYGLEFNFFLGVLESFFLRKQSVFWSSISLAP